MISNKMEKLIDGMIDQKIDPEPMALKALKQTIDALMRYLHVLIDGVDENPMCLFPTYRNLMQAQGVKDVSESDFIFRQLGF